VDRGQLQALIRPTVLPNGKRIPGLKLDHPSAFDGLEAVQMAEEDQPDLVLLDIGLTELSGIEAGRRIRRLAPHAKLLFVSSESAPDVVRKTFRPGGGLMLIKLAVIAI
jgi:CheY-like chemotaxis protein